MILEMKDVSKQYNDFRLNCSLSVREGYVTGLIGRNGAGKSTAFKSVLGLVHEDSGEIRLFGKKNTEITLKEKEDISVVFLDSGFSGYLSISDIIPIMKALYHNFDKERFIEQCIRFQLPMKKNIKDFSTGMKAKLKIIIALSHDARFLILDEPTAGLDVIARDEILEMLREYMEDESRAILINSHISSDLEGLCDDIYMIHEGEILLHEDTDVLLDEYAVIKLNEDQYNSIDKQYLMRVSKEKYGYCCLTNQKRFYQENYPGVVIEKSGIDDMILMMEKGEAL